MSPMPRAVILRQGRRTQEKFLAFAWVLHSVQDDRMKELELRT